MENTPTPTLMPTPILPLSGNKKRTRSPEEEDPRRTRPRPPIIEVEEIVPVNPEIEVENVPAAPAIDQINQYINEIINGQVDITVDPEAAASTSRQRASDLMTELNRIIAQKEQQAQERQITIAEARREEMEEVERAQIIDENIQMITAINNALARSNERLGRSDRLALNRRIQQLINDTITAAQVNEQLEAEARPLRESIRGLYNGLIQYYTEMASYGYQRAPEVLANIGSMLGGTAMIGAAVVGGGNGSPAGTLMTLANYLGTATITASGLYLLQRGGLPVQGFLESTGAATRQCIERRCQQIAEYGVVGLTSLMNQARERLNTFLEQDPDSDILSQSTDSSDSSYSTASSASQAISRVLVVPLQQQRDEILGEVPDDEPLTQDQYPDMSAIDGGRKRKSRRHTKSKKSRRGKKGRKGRMTKKGRKHHKTMKRYRSKMRR